MTTSPQRERFTRLVAEMREREGARDDYRRAAESAETHGEYVVWFRGVPLPELERLADPDAFVDWIDGIFAADERPQVRRDLPGALESLAVRRALLAFVADPTPAERAEARRLGTFLARVDALYPRIVDNCEHLGLGPSVAVAR